MSVVHPTARASGRLWRCCGVTVATPHGVASPPRAAQRQRGRTRDAHPRPPRTVGASSSPGPARRRETPRPDDARAAVTPDTAPTRRRRSSFPERGKGTDGRRAARGPRYMSARPAPASSTLAPSAARPGVRSRILSASPPRPRPGDPPRRARRTHPTRVPGRNEGRRARERTSTAQYASGRNAPAAGAAGGTEPRASNR